MDLELQIAPEKIQTEYLTVYLGNIFQNQYIIP